MQGKEHRQSQVHMKMLLQSLQLLVAPFEQQVLALPPYVHIPDEIALIFDDAYKSVDLLLEKGLVTTPQKDLLEQMNTLLAQMSKITHLWTLHELREATAWQQVRSLASKLLASFKVAKQPPHLFWIHYIPASEEKQS